MSAASVSRTRLLSASVIGRIFPRLSPETSGIHSDNSARTGEAASVCARSACEHAAAESACSMSCAEMRSPRSVSQKRSSRMRRSSPATTSRDAVTSWEIVPMASRSATASLVRCESTSICVALSALAAVSVLATRSARSSISVAPFNRANIVSARTSDPSACAHASFIRPSRCPSSPSSQASLLLAACSMRSSTSRTRSNRHASSRSIHCIFSCTRFSAASFIELSALRVIACNCPCVCASNS